MIDGVEIKELVTHSDDRGFFREIIRSSDSFFREGFGQWSQSLVFQDVIKAWHYHKIQTDWWYIVSGVVRVGLADMRKESPSFGQVMDFYMGDYQPSICVKIPPGVAHGCKAIQGPASIFYFTSHVYDPEDEYRLPYDTAEIDFDWLKGPKIT